MIKDYIFNPIEYKLTGNEFKLLQLLKTIKEPISYNELSKKTNINDRSLRNIVRVLHGMYIIEKEIVKGKNKYTINSYEKWLLQ